MKSRKAKKTCGSFVGKFVSHVTQFWQLKWKMLKDDMLSARYHDMCQGLEIVVTWWLNLSFLYVLSQYSLIVSGRIK